MRNSAKDTKSCETCKHCASVHLEKDEEYCRDMLHYCKARKKIVDKDDKCRKWQKSKLLHDCEQDDMGDVLAQLKDIYKC
ncbi:MAG: hypothetical protein K2M47_00970 [Clostridiales bacterium]|nr:hypothetical protein [Clostridiales bacterium]